MYFSEWGIALNEGSLYLRYLYTKDKGKVPSYTLINCQCLTFSTKCNEPLFKLSLDVNKLDGIQYSPCPILPRPNSPKFRIAPLLPRPNSPKGQYSQNYFVYPFSNRPIAPKRRFFSIWRKSPWLPRPITPILPWIYL